MIDRRPLLIARCTDAADAITAGPFLRKCESLPWEKWDLENAEKLTDIVTMVAPSRLTRSRLKPKGTMRIAVHTHSAQQFVTLSAMALSRKERHDFKAYGISEGDVLVDPEKVVGIILALNLHQPVVVAAIICSHSSSVVVVHKVNIASDL